MRLNGAIRTMRRVTDDGETAPPILPNDFEAQSLFKVAALTYKHPVGMFLHGKGLVHGGIGLEKDATLGLSLLNKAGAAHIAEAYFELGFIYETGAGGAVMRDCGKARDYYLAVVEVCISQDFLGTPHWYSDLDSTQMLASRMELFHDTFMSGAEKIGQRFAWTVAGQAFLFGAAVSLARAKDLYHFSALFFVVPLLGLVIALWSVTMTGDSRFDIAARERPVMEMTKAKLFAFQRLVLTIFGEDVKGYPVWIQKTLFQLKMTVWRRRIVAAGASLFFALINICLVLSWLILLLQEIRSEDVDDPTV